MDNGKRLRVLHICPDYPHTQLYHLLISHLEIFANNIVYVSQSELPVTKDYPVVFTGKDFGVVDRALYFHKQKCISDDIKARQLAKDVHLVHAHSLFSAGYAAMKLYKAQGIPYVVAVRNTDVNTFFHYMVHLRRLGVKVMENAAAVIFLSPAYKRTVLDKYIPKRKREIIAKKSFVIPNGIDKLYLDNTPSVIKQVSRERLHLIYVGEVNTNKNLTTTLKACELLKSKGYNISIKVVGKISEHKLSYVKELPFVEYHQHCDKEELLEYYKQSDIFVMPSLHETFGLVYAEALSQGLPIIYSRGQGFDGYFAEGQVGYHVRSKNSVDIAKAIVTIASSYNVFSARAKEASQSFSWERIASVYEKIYRQIVNHQVPSVMEYQRCTRCVMDNASDYTITFDTEGHCNYCEDILSRRDNEYFPDERGRKILEKLIEKIKREGKGKKYDCIVGISGGLDSSYVVYLGHQYGLRMLAVHIDDGLDTEIAKLNITSLCEKAGVDLINISPDKEQYSDLLLSFFKASVPNLAMVQDNLLKQVLHDTTRKYGIKYSLSGANFAHESILERSTGINAMDKTHILAIHKQFGTKPIDKLRIGNLWTAYIGWRYFSKAETIYPLNYIDYNKKRVLDELKDFSEYNYYGGKHYESILCRFMQCYYLPTKYNFDKRKSHFSSLIVDGQMTREEALVKLNKPAYTSEELKEHDMNFLAQFFRISREEFDKIIALPAKQHSDYPMSLLENTAGLARKFRKYLG